MAPLAMTAETMMQTNGRRCTPAPMTEELRINWKKRGMK